MRALSLPLPPATCPAAPAQIRLSGTGPVSPWRTWIFFLMAWASSDSASSTPLASPPPWPPRGRRHRRRHHHPKNEGTKEGTKERSRTTRLNGAGARGRRRRSFGPPATSPRAFVNLPSALVMHSSLGLFYANIILTSVITNHQDHPTALFVVRRADIVKVPDVFCVTAYSLSEAWPSTLESKCTLRLPYGPTAPPMTPSLPMTPPKDDVELEDKVSLTREELGIGIRLLHEGCLSTVKWVSPLGPVA